MDQRTHDVEEDLRQIVRTRVALSDKVETLERRVTEMAYDTKAAAADTVETAKGKAMSWVDQASRRLQVRQRPWIVAGGVMAVALLTGWMRRRRSSGLHAYYPENARGADVMPARKPRALRRGVYPFYSRPTEASGSSKRADQESASQESGNRSDMDAGDGDLRQRLSGLWGEVSEELVKEGTRLQNTAMQIGLSFLRDLTHIAGRIVVDQLDGMQGRRHSANELSRGRVERI